MTPPGDGPATGPGTVLADDLLDSWKQIATYLRRDVRTVTRWESTRGLPVHRLPKGARRAVYARKSELETWRENADAARPSAPAAPPPSIAVLPFVNLTPDKDNEYFADGLADEIITRLAGVPRLRVTARTSSFAFRGQEGDVREIGARLGVSALLEGTLQKVGDRLRVTVQLIGTGDGYHLWAEQFDRSADDVFAVQDEIAEGVVANLKDRLLPCAPAVPERRHHPPPAAFQAYLKGRYFLSRRGPGQIQRAIECFEQAASIDPDYASAHLGTAGCLATLGLWEMLPPGAAFGRVKVAAARALAIDGSIGAAHLLLGVAALADRDWGLARRHFQQAEDRSATDSGPFGLGFYYVLDGRPDAALRYAHKRLERDPLSAIERTQAAALHVALERFDSATTLLDEALDLDNQVPMTLFWLGFCHGVQGRFDEAVPLLRSAAERGVALALSYLVAVLVRADELGRARAVHAELEEAAAGRYVSAMCLAVSHAALGHKDRCLEFLFRAEHDRSPTYAMFLLGPGYLALSPEWLRRWCESRKRHVGLAGGPAVPARGARADRAGRSR